jgi:hypothetical protein
MSAIAVSRRPQGGDSSKETQRRISALQLSVAFPDSCEHRRSCASLLATLLLECNCKANREEEPSMGSWAGMAAQGFGRKGGSAAL